MSNKRTKAVNLFKYLRDVVKLQQKTTRNIDDYQDHLWFDDIPRDVRECHLLCRALKDEEGAKDVWLETKRRREPKMPEVPATCKPWVDPNSLGDSNHLPELYTEIQQPVSDDAGLQQIDASEEGESSPIFETLRLVDYPKISNRWQSYIDGKWKKWAESHQEWKTIHQCYTRLFQIYQQIKKNPEQYELVVGIGLLTWETPKGPSVRRHVLTANCTLEFNAEQAIFSLRPGINGARLRLETDMLRHDEKPSLENVEAVKAEVLGIEDSPWDKKPIEAVLHKWSNYLGVGEYRHDESPQEVIGPVPQIHFAPALIVRRRTLHESIRFQKKIVEALENNGKIPAEVNRLVVDGNSFHSEQLRASSGPHDLECIKNQEVYFPLPANEEQRKIVSALASSSGILVQGPPGCGKSHTIANLISDLLAKGQRILVTAKTPRALKVLQDKLPDGLSRLCVSLLGKGQEDLNNLQASVQEICGCLADWNSDRESHLHSITGCEEALHEGRRNIALWKNELRGLREREITEQKVSDTRYRGTAQTIAQHIRGESQDFLWFQDVLDPECPMPFGTATFEELRKSFISIDENRAAGLDQVIPDIDKLALPEKFAEWVRAEEAAQDSVDQCVRAKQYPGYMNLSRASTETICDLRRSVQELQKIIHEAKRYPSKWVEQAVHDVRVGKANAWKTLLSVTEKNLAKIGPIVEQVDEWSLSHSAQVSEAQMMADANELKKRMKREKQLNWIQLILLKLDRRRSYLVNDLRVDGRLCRDSESIDRLIMMLDVRRALYKMWSRWESKESRVEGSVAEQVCHFEHYIEALKPILSIVEKIASLNSACDRISGLESISWDSDQQLDNLNTCCELIIALRKLNESKVERCKLLDFVRDVKALDNVHPFTEEIYRAIESSAVERYSELCRSIKSHAVDRERLETRRKNYAALAVVAPQLAQALAENPENEQWDDRLPAIADAWGWAKADQSLKSFMLANNQPQIKKKLRQQKSENDEQLAKLASLLAWKHFLDRMNKNDTQRQHLVAWQQKMKQIGKGTGKYASKHRREAQKHLEKCQDVIPAWVMPLHRVFETIPPAAEMFDVVIVDEASQCGLESLALNYMAKKIIIVGDDKQIKPEYPGIDRQEVDRLVQKHLCDHPMKDCFGIEHSLYDHAELRYGQPIVLREHFRCMPEIIRFSNDLCYRKKPLIPLRQYPPRRLRPVVPIHVADGYRTGRGSNVVNQSEAETLVKWIVACCNDEKYEKKSMGVICLQGKAQAKYIETLILQHLDPEEIESRNILCGDAYSFQGDERDVIFLSLVAANNERNGTLSNQSFERSFNVAASRAKDQIWLFHSVQLNDLSQSCMRHKLLKFFMDPISSRSDENGNDIQKLEHLAIRADRPVDKPPKPFDSWFEVDVYLSIVREGYRVVPQHEVAGYRIDLVVEGSSSRLAVECDGDYWHGPERWDKDAVRQDKLERCGWEFCRITGSEFSYAPEKSLEDLWRELEARGIERCSTGEVMLRELDGYVPDLVDSSHESSCVAVDAASEKRRGECNGVSQKAANDSSRSNHAVTSCSATRGESPSTDLSGRYNALKANGSIVARRVWTDK